VWVGGVGFSLAVCLSIDGYRSQWNLKDGLLTFGEVKVKVKVKAARLQVGTVQAAGVDRYL